MQTNPQHAAPAYAPFETGRDARRRGGLLIAATALDSEIAGTTLRAARYVKVRWRRALC